MNYPLWASLAGSIVLYTTISPTRDGSILRNLRIYNPGPGQNSAGEVKNFSEALAFQELRHLGTAPAGAADHNDFLFRVEFRDPIGDLAHGDMHRISGNRRQFHLPILAHVEKGHVLSGGAPDEEFLRG